jgi:hypothetical protein
MIQAMLLLIIRAVIYVYVRVADMPVNLSQNENQWEKFLF